MEQVQLVVAANKVESVHFGGEKMRGDVVWVSDRAAQVLLAAGVCVWPGELGMPSERPVAGPKERPMAGPEEAPIVAPDETPLGGAVERKKPLRRSAGWPVDRYAVVERAWEGETVVCIGGGPSLNKDEVASIAGKARVIAINDAYLIAPFADVCYFADARWWEWHSKGTKKNGLDAQEVARRFKEFAGQKVTIENTGMMVSDPEVHMLHNYGSDGLSERANGLHTGSNSGYQAINLAFLAGARRILLIGYDMRFEGTRTHWHEGHPVKHPEGAYKNYANRFASMLPALKKRGIEVVNCTPGSAVKCFPAGDLAKELARA